MAVVAIKESRIKFPDKRRWKAIDKVDFRKTATMMPDEISSTPPGDSDNKKARQ